MPEDMLRRSTVTGIEIDPLTASIAKALYPDTDIRAQAFEQTKIAMNFTTSPFPTSRWRLHRPRPALESYKFSIHDYFFAAALEKVRPGGLMMFVTSRGTMDKLDSTLRELLSRARSCSEQFVFRMMLSKKTPHGGHDRHRDASQAAPR